MAESQRVFRPRPPVAGGLLVLLTLAIYLPAFSCGFIWDDDAHVTDSGPVLRADGLAAIWFEPGSVKQYYPLTHSSFWLEYRLWGDSPLGYHVVNVLLHALAAVLLWRVLEELSLPGAWLAAVLFAVHPLHVESVAWITERKNTLSAVFALGSAWAWFVWWRSEPGSRRGTWWLSLGLFAAALLSKSVTVTLPAVLLVVAWWKQGRLGRRELLAVLPMVALAVPMAVMTVYSEQQHIGTRHLDLGLSPLDRLLIAGRAVWFYVGHLAWPVRLTFIYPRWSIEANSWAAWLWPLAAIVVVVTLWVLRARLGRGPLAIGLLFVGMLTPALGFIDIYPMQFSFVADHFCYLAGIPLLAGVAWLFVEKRYMIQFGVLAGVLAVLTWRQCGIYESPMTLWSDTVHKNPGSALAQTHLGNEYGARGNHVDAIKNHRLAIEADERYADAWNNLAVELKATGQDDEALQAATRAVELAGWLPAARLNLGMGLADDGRYDEAVEQLKAAVGLDGDFLQAWVVLARVQALRGDDRGMLEAIDRVGALDPGLGRRLADELAAER